MQLPLSLYLTFGVVSSLHSAYSYQPKGTSLSELQGFGHHKEEVEKKLCFSPEVFGVLSEEP